MHFPLRLLALAVLLTASAAAQAPRDYVEGEVIVTFKETADLPAARQALNRRTLALTKHFRALSAHRRRETGLVRAPGRTTEALIADLQQDPTIETVEPNYLRRFSVAAPTNDPSFAQLWGLRNSGQSINGDPGTAGADIQFVGAWGLVPAPTGAVIVAVLDSGIDYTHPDLVSNLWTNAGETPGNATDDDGNGYIDDFYGYDFVNDIADPLDSGSHGTHVSGTIAATGNNQIGVVGVNFHARLMTLKISQDGNLISVAATIEAIQYATLMKGRGENIVAINASFGGSNFSSAERAAIEAAGAAGIIFVAAAGNDHTNNDIKPEYPASYRLPNMLVVAASDQQDRLANFSNYGATTVDLAAPGVNILSTFPLTLAGTTATVQRAGTSYVAEGLTYAGTTTGITATVHDCGLGYPPDFPPAVAGNIALIERGTLLFSEKVQNAMTAGATAAIIYNNVDGIFLGNLQTVSNWIPAVGVARADGLALLAALPTTATVINQVDPKKIYQYLDGTSMAAPHVAGAVAFAALFYPGETMAQRLHRILANTDALTNLATKMVTGGRLNLQRSFTGAGQPVASNAVAEVAGVTVVLPNVPVVFAASITNFVGASTNCLWIFSDGQTSSDCGPTHVFTECGPATVTSVVTDGVTPVSNTFALAVACPPVTLRTSLKANFASAKPDQAKVKGVIELPVGVAVNSAVQLSVGSIAVPFQLDAKGRGVSGLSKLLLKRKGKPVGARQPWQFSATLKGDWAASWAADGLVNATTQAPVTVPVLLFLNNSDPEAFYENKSLQYKATAGKSGMAK